MMLFTHNDTSGINVAEWLTYKNDSQFVTMILQMFPFDLGVISPDYISKVILLEKLKNQIVSHNLNLEISRAMRPDDIHACIEAMKGDNPSNRDLPDFFPGQIVSNKGIVEVVLAFNKGLMGAPDNYLTLDTGRGFIGHHDQSETFIAADPLSIDIDRIVEEKSIGVYFERYDSSIQRFIAGKPIRDLYRGIDELYDFESLGENMARGAALKENPSYKSPPNQTTVLALQHPDILQNYSEFAENIKAPRKEGYSTLYDKCKDKIMSPDFDINAFIRREASKLEDGLDKRKLQKLMNPLDPIHKAPNAVMSIVQTFMEIETPDDNVASASNKKESTQNTTNATGNSSTSNATGSSSTSNAGQSMPHVHKVQYSEEQRASLSQPRTLGFDPGHFRETITDPDFRDCECFSSECDEPDEDVPAADDGDIDNGDDRNVDLENVEPIVFEDLTPKNFSDNNHTGNIQDGDDVQDNEDDQDNEDSYDYDGYDYDYDSYDYDGDDYFYSGDYIDDDDDEEEYEFQYHSDDEDNGMSLQDIAAMLHMLQGRGFPTEHPMSNFVHTLANILIDDLPDEFEPEPSNTTPTGASASRRTNSTSTSRPATTNSNTESTPATGTATRATTNDAGSSNSSGDLKKSEDFDLMDVE